MAARATLSFGTFNLYNLNEPGLAMYGNQSGWAQAQYDNKIAWAAGILKTMAADVWGVQELWHRQSLHNVFARARLASRYKLLVPAGHAGQRIVCGAAVRKEILVGEPEWITDFPADFVLRSGGDDAQTSDIAVQVNTFSRPVLHFEVQPRANGRRIHVYVCHLKSKRPAQVFREAWYSKPTHGAHAEAIGAAISTIRRTAEAAALRMLLTERMKGTDTPVVVLGDLNDSQLSNTLNILTGQPNYLLSGLQTGGSDTDLYSTATLQEYRSLRDVYYSHVHQNVKESLDHILVSQEFYDNSKKRLWAFDGMEIANDHLNHERHKDDGSTDHGIVRASFFYKPA